MLRSSQRGGLDRPVVRSSPSSLTAAGLSAVIVWALLISRVAAHGGVPTLQIGSERINPGGTIELVGDMTTEGPVEIVLVAPAEASVHTLGALEADFEGHFRAFVIIPSDVPLGTYQVRARMAAEEARVPLIVTGTPVTGEEGRLPGQDEALAGVTPLNPSPVGAPVGRPARPFETTGANLGLVAAGAAVLMLLAALGVGTLVRMRSRRPAP